MEQLHYLTPQNNVGMLADVPQIDPVILEFADGLRDAFYKDDLKPTTAGITPISGSLFFKRKRSVGKQVKRVTVEKQLKLLAFLCKQTRPVKKKECEEALGFRCVYILSRQRDYDSVLSLEELGLVVRSYTEQRWIFWEVTEKARTHGEEFIKAQYPGYDQTTNDKIDVKPSIKRSKVGIKRRTGIKPLSEVSDPQLFLDFSSTNKTPRMKKNRYPEVRHSEPRVKRVTIERQLKLLSFLREQSNPVKIKECERVLGFRCTYIMSRQRDHDILLSLEELELVKRAGKQGSSIVWSVTSLAEDGETLIKAQYPYYEDTDTKTMVVRKRSAPFRSTPKTSKRDPIAKGILLLDLLKKQTEPIGTPALEKSLKFRLHKKLATFQELGIVVSIPISKCSNMWELTERGRRYGSSLIKEHYSTRRARTH